MGSVTERVKTLFFSPLQPRGGGGPGAGGLGGGIPCPLPSRPPPPRPTRRQTWLLAPLDLLQDSQVLPGVVVVLANYKGILIVLFWFLARLK